MNEITINNEIYTLKSGPYFSYIVEKNGEKMFNLYPYKRIKDKFIISLFKTQINLNDIKIIEQNNSGPIKNDISTFNELILNDLEKKQNIPVQKKISINNYKKF